MSETEDRSFAMLLHILGIVTSFVGPLIMWLVLRKDHPFVARHGRDYMNWALTLLIAYVIGFILIIVFIGILVVFALGILNLVYCILNAIRANKGEEASYPFSIKFIKTA